VAAVHFPLVFHNQISLKMEKKIIRRHYPAGEKITPHPVFRALGCKGIGEFSMTKDVNEEFPLRFEPRPDAR
jgi:hypothetical protein